MKLSVTWLLPIIFVQVLLFTGTVRGATEFVCSLKQDGSGDYTTFWGWETTNQTDLANEALVFSHGGITGTIPDLTAVVGVNNSYSGVVTHATATQVMIKDIRSQLPGIITRGHFSSQLYGTNFLNDFVVGDKIWLNTPSNWLEIINIYSDVSLKVKTSATAITLPSEGDTDTYAKSVSFTAGEKVEMKENDSNYFTVQDDGDSVIAVLECYKTGWETTGHQSIDPDSFYLEGWMTTSNNYIVIRAAEGHSHDGTPTNPAGEYTGFALTAGVNFGMLKIRQHYTRIEGIIIDTVMERNLAPIRIESYLANGTIIDKCIIIQRGVNVPLDDGIRTGINDCTIRNSLLIGSGANAGINHERSTIVDVYNCTIVNFGTGIYEDPAGAAGGASYINNLIYNCATSIVLDADSPGTYDYNATDLASLPTGTANQTDQTFSFFDEDTSNYHLSFSDVGARRLGTNLYASAGFIDDIDGDKRTDPWDIGMDNPTMGAMYFIR